MGLDLATLADDPRKHAEETWQGYATRRGFEVCGRMLRTEAIIRAMNRQAMLVGPDPEPTPVSEPPKRRKRKRGRR